VGKRVGGRAMKMSVAPKAAKEEESITGMVVDRADLCAKMLEELLQRHEQSGLLALHFFKQCTGVSFDKVSKSRQQLLVTKDQEVYSLWFLEERCDLHSCSWSGRACQSNVLAK
jgi:hypothetical protein